MNDIELSATVNILGSEFNYYYFYNIYYDIYLCHLIGFIAIYLQMKMMP